MTYIPDVQGVRAAQAGLLVHRPATPLVDGSLFTITGGRVLVNTIIGVVTTDIGGGAQSIQIDFDPLAAGSIQNISVSTSISGDPAGTLYGLPDGFGVDALQVAPPDQFLRIVTLFESPAAAPDGDVILNVTGPEAGEIEWFLFYYPLQDSARVVVS